jgi:hypothetical protein
MKRTTFFILGIILFILLTSCDLREPIDNWDGAIIDYKGSESGRGRGYMLRVNYESDKITGERGLSKIYVSKFDHKKYNVGDTIKGTFKKYNDFRK